jgi:hypothetical protein
MSDSYAKSDSDAPMSITHDSSGRSTHSPTSSVGYDVFQGDEEEDTRMQSPPSFGQYSHSDNLNWTLGIFHWFSELCDLIYIKYSIPRRPII